MQPEVLYRMCEECEKSMLRLVGGDYAYND